MTGSAPSVTSLRAAPPRLAGEEKQLDSLLPCEAGGVARAAGA
jgi:hypothetical protein